MGIRQGKLELKNGTSTVIARHPRIRSALIVIGALLLFIGGLLLLFAPVQAQDQSGPGAQHFPDGGNGWIMGSQSHESVSLAGG